jgi:hypothetical protein
MRAREVEEDEADKVREAEEAVAAHQRALQQKHEAVLQAASAAEAAAQAAASAHLNAHMQLKASIAAEEAGLPPPEHSMRAPQPTADAGAMPMLCYAVCQSMRSWMCGLIVRTAL